MSDTITRLNAALQGRYRIERQLGEGGMATVYLAEDVKHKRKVALKVLKPELAALVGAERFLAEIETTASLQHPHILPLFDSGEADGFLFYVMPYVEGETLRERIEREHQLPVDEAVAISTKVAGALQAAHERGVIHRDIKPANILLAKGEPLISDFGIALAVSAGGAGRLTETGLSLGTPHYMSPEQATGDASVGPATDVYALGCVLYEMLVGEPPYTGSTPQAILGKIVTGDADPVTKHRRTVPANVDAAIRKALEKVPADRFGSASELARALGEVGFRHGQVAGVGGFPTGPAGPWKRLTVAFASLAAVMTLAFSWSLTRGGSEAAPLNRRFELGVGALAPLPVFNSSAELAISRDGSKIAYAAVSGSLSSLHVRSLDQTETRVLAGTGVVFSPFFSPDGEWIGYLDPRAGEVKKISVQGGQPIVLAPFRAFSLGGTWLDDGTIVFPSGGANPSLFRVPEAGGTPVQLTQAEPGTAHFFPEALPGGRAILFTALSSRLDLGSGRIDMLSLETGEVRTIVDVGYAPRYLPSGHLVFARQGSLWAIPFDPRSGQTAGQAVVVLQGVEMSSSDRPTAAFSPQGLMVYLPGEAAGAAASTARRSLVWVDEDGAEEPLPLPAREYWGPRLSPDGTRLAVAVFDGEAWALWVYDVASGAALRLTQSGGSQNMLPIWTPDGSRIFYRSTDAPNGSPGDLYSIPSDGSGGPQRITNVDNADDNPTSISPDGTTVIFIRILDPGPNQRYEIMAVAADGSGEARPILQGDFTVGNAALSPDGRWLAYRSNESGQFEIYLQPYPGPGAKTPVSIGGGNWVVWSPDGSTIYYRGAGRFMAVDVTLGASARVGRPRELFPDTPYFEPTADGGARQYHVAPDGRFLLIRRGQAATNDNAHLVVVENWLDELERLVPTGR